MSNSESYSFVTIMNSRYLRIALCQMQRVLSCAFNESLSRIQTIRERDEIAERD